MALANSSSRFSPVEAPVRTLILKGFPWAWISLARAARALGTALAEAAAANPLNVTWPRGGYGLLPPGVIGWDIVT